MNKKKLLNLFFKKKTIYEINYFSNSKTSLRKNLSLLQVISLGIGVLVGGGIFVVTGMASSLHTGPAITISFFLCGLMCICAGLCYAEFASVVKNSGSSYSYIYLTFGKFPAWIIGFFSIIGYLFGSVSVVIGWSNYMIDFIYLFNFQFMYFLSHNYPNFLFIIPIFIICLFSTYVLYKGINISSIITNISVIIKLSVLFLFIFIGFFYIDISNWSPYIPKNTGVFGQYGYSGIFAGISVIFLSFNGFDAICSAAQEVKNPTTNIPIAIIFTILIVTFIYISASAIVTGLVSYKHLNVPQVLSCAIKNINIKPFIVFIKAGTIFGLASVIIISQYTIIRMLFAIIKDNTNIPYLTDIHKKNYVPHNLTIFVGFVMFFLSSYSHIQDIVKFSSILILITVFSVCLASLFNNYYQKSYRKFICPFMPFPPIIFIFFSFYIFYSYSLKIYLSLLFLFLSLTFFYAINVYFFSNDKFN